MLVELRGVTKRFGTLVANDDVTIDVKPGEVHALLGENGAGKSTLMNVLFGMIQPDAGVIALDGTPCSIKDPGDAVRLGIGMVHQHFMLVPVFTVAENVVLGAEPTVGGILDRRGARCRIRQLSEEYGLEVDPAAVVENLPVGLQQRVEILKALNREARLLILDEPTAVLTPQETEALFKIIRSLTAAGRSVLFISHKLKEVLQIADRITVMRRGRVVGTTTPAEATEASLAQMMVGRAVELVVAKGIAQPKDVVLRLEELEVADNRGVLMVDGVSLDVRAGEILAIAGVQGNGQTELVEAIVGLRPVLAGKVELLGITDSRTRRAKKVLDAFRRGIGRLPLRPRRRSTADLGAATTSNGSVGQSRPARSWARIPAAIKSRRGRGRRSARGDVTGARPRRMLDLGLAHIPEDRQHDGLVPPMSIADNLVLNQHAKPPNAKFGTRRLGPVRQHAEQMLKEFDIRAVDGSVAVRTLSGGNQQKVVVARELSRPIRVLVAAQPTRGLDVGSIEYVHQRIVEARDAGVAVLLVSSELDEVLALGDRIAVMYRGAVVGLVDPSVGREHIGLLMAGAVEGGTRPEGGAVVAVPA